jgi:hypothetical protein
MKLREYQLDIVRRGTSVLRYHHLLYLAMQVRTGKTITSLSIAQEYGARSVLFVTKKKAMSSIASDFEAGRFSFEFDLVNYEALHKITTAQALHFDFIIADEAHTLGAFPTPNERTRQLRTLAYPKGGKPLPVILLSGTPTPESYSQMFHQLWVSHFTPWSGQTFYQWARDYVNVTKRHIYNREVNDYSDADESKVMGDCQPFMISFTQEEAGFTELVNDHVIEIEMKPGTYEGIKRLIRDRVLKTSNGVVIADTAVALQNKVHQLCSGSVILDEPSGLFESYAFDMTKADFIRDHFRGVKIAIFYKFKAERMLLSFVFAERIVDSPEEFNAGDKNAVYISQIASGREGINLSTADALVMFNIDFSAVSYWQARARMQSKDRERPADVYWIFARGGIEPKIYEQVLKKRNYTLTHFKKDFLTQ